MNINEIKKTFANWQSQPGIPFPKSRVKAKKFFEIRHGEKRELVLAIAECRDGLRVECFQGDASTTRPLGSLLYGIEDPYECFSRFEAYLNGTL